MRPIDQIAFGVSQTDSQGAQLLMPLEEFGQLFTFTDPDVGDSLQVVTVAQPGLGMDEERAYPEFQLLASASFSRLPCASRPPVCSPPLSAV